MRPGNWTSQQREPVTANRRPELCSTVALVEEMSLGFTAGACWVWIQSATQNDLGDWGTN